MKIPSAEQMRMWDRFTILHEPISSIDLMERAARCCLEKITETYAPSTQLHVFCGSGNNGGDGLALARMLAENNYSVTVYCCATSSNPSPDNSINLERLQQRGDVLIIPLKSPDDFHDWQPKSGVIIDALFGTGINRPVEGLADRLIDHLNESGMPILAIDMPSGLPVDAQQPFTHCIRATETYTFQSYKLPLLFAESHPFTGKIHVLDIGLHPGFLIQLETQYRLTTETDARKIYRPRNLFAHKGNFGHALLLAGSTGKGGAALLAARSCMRSGAGLLTCHVPGSIIDLLQIGIPEAMVSASASGFIDNLPASHEKFDAVGIGPGIGRGPETAAVLKKLFSVYTNPVVIDADALNILAAAPALLHEIPPGSILTPHAREFDRLFGNHPSDRQRIEKAVQKAKAHKLIILLKGHRSLVALPDGSGCFNSTGNPGMATAGSGDVLTGILTGLLAQGYSPTSAAILGVYIHGWAGDLAAAKYSQESMLAGDITSMLGMVFKRLASGGA
jgi:NAD(P)H-hydrate epimerase